MMTPDLNPFLPVLARLTMVQDLATGIKLFRCQPLSDAQPFHYRPGQFGFLSAFGVGESPFGLAVSEGRSGGQVEFAVQRVGTVTDALHELGPGDLVGLRGPMGNGFPMEDLRQAERLLILGGGIGLAPLRPLIQEILDNRADYGALEILCAARSPELLCFRDEYEAWASAARTVVHVTVDQGNETWSGKVGLITQLLAELAPSPAGTVAVTCGPPIMIKFVLRELDKLGFTPPQILTTLEGKMKCGIGKCGRCNVGEHYICCDGPVFRYDQIQGFLEQF